MRGKATPGKSRRVRAPVLTVNMNHPRSTKSLVVGGASRVGAFALAAAVLAGGNVPPLSRAQEAKPAPAALVLDPKAILLTVFFRHDQTKTLDEIQAHLKRTGFEKNFPPAGVEVVSYYVMMGIGQVVVLRVPPEKLREVNVMIERGAWGAYRTEFFPTYDYKPIWEANRAKEAAAAAPSPAGTP